MRDYGRVAPSFWTGATARRLRGFPEAQVVAMYLVTCPSANMIGLYYLPVELLAHETGMSAEGAKKALHRCSEAGFCRYDDASDVVWVPNMASYQIGDELKAKDLRKAGVLRELNTFRKHAFALEFWNKYAVPYGLDRPQWLPSTFEAPSKPLRSQDQDQDQEQEQDPPQPPEGAQGGGDDERNESPPGPTPTGAPESGTLATETPNAQSRAFVLPRSERAAWGKLWLDTYETAVGDALKREWAIDRRQVAVIEQVLNKFCKSKSTPEDWIRRWATEFVRAVDGENETLWSEYQPRGFLRWCNKGRPGYREPAPARAAIASSEAPAESPCSPEEAAQNARRVKDLLAGFGKGGLGATG